MLDQKTLMNAVPNQLGLSSNFMAIAVTILLRLSIIGMQRHNLQPSADWLLSRCLVK
jgi:hypothetical protein